MISTVLIVLTAILLIFGIGLFIIGFDNDKRLTSAVSIIWLICLTGSFIALLEHYGLKISITW